MYAGDSVLINEYKQEKNIVIKKLSNSCLILKAVIVMLGVCAFYLMVVLVSFSPTDPSWSQTAWHDHIYNIGGIIGAWVADTLFLIFGLLAYVLPPITLFFCWKTFAHCEHVDFFYLSLRLIGILVLLLDSCALAALNVDDICYFSSGGLIGTLLSSIMFQRLNNIGTTLVLLCVWAYGLTLFTGWSWLSIAEKIGSVVICCSDFVFSRIKSTTIQVYEGYCRADQKAAINSVLHIDEEDESTLVRPLDSEVVAHHREMEQSTKGADERLLARHVSSSHKN